MSPMQMCSPCEELSSAVRMNFRRVINQLTSSWFEPRLTQSGEITQCGTSKSCSLTNIGSKIRRLDRYA